MILPEYSKFFVDVSIALFVLMVGVCVCMYKVGGVCACIEYKY